MAIVSPAPPSTQPTNLAPLVRLLAYAQMLGLGPHLHRLKRGLPTPALALLWLVLAWRGSGRPEHPGHGDELLLAALPVGGPAWRMRPGRRPMLRRPRLYPCRNA